MKLIVILLKGFCNLTVREKALLKTLKLRKNTLRIMDNTIENRGMLSSSSLLHWTEVEDSEVDKLFDDKRIIHLNNPKKGHIYKNYGNKPYELFKKEFIDRMYLRK